MLYRQVIVLCSAVQKYYICTVLEGSTIFRRVCVIAKRAYQLRHVRTYEYDPHRKDFREFDIGDLHVTPLTNSKFGSNRPKTSDISH
jgi:hypothetical protein